jgi:type II secretion system protein G
MNIPPSVRAQLGQTPPKRPPDPRRNRARNALLSRFSAFISTSYGQRLIIWTVGPLFFLLVHLTIKHYQPAHRKFSFPEDVQRTAQNLRVLRTALEMFHADCKRYPTTAETMSALVRNPGIRGWKGPYIRALYLDPWLHPYQYAYTNDTLQLWSLGADGRTGTDDDVQGPTDADAHPGTTTGPAEAPRGERLKSARTVSGVPEAK